MIKKMFPRIAKVDRTKRINALACQSPTFAHSGGASVCTSCCTAGSRGSGGCPNAAILRQSACSFRRRWDAERPLGPCGDVLMSRPRLASPDWSLDAAPLGASSRRPASSAAMAAMRASRSASWRWSDSASFLAVAAICALLLAVF
jgi:hypothetical protein